MEKSKEEMLQARRSEIESKLDLNKYSPIERRDAVMELKEIKRSLNKFYLERDFR